MVAELVDALVLGTSIVRCEGSSPFHGTYGNFVPRCNNFGSFSIICYRIISYRCNCIISFRIVTNSGISKWSRRTYPASTGPSVEE